MLNKLVDQIFDICMSGRADAEIKSEIRRKLYNAFNAQLDTCLAIINTAHNNWKRTDLNSFIGNRDNCMDRIILLVINYMIDDINKCKDDIKLDMIKGCDNGCK